MALPELTVDGLLWAERNVDSLVTARLALEMLDAPDAHIAAAIRIANEQARKERDSRR